MSPPRSTSDIPPAATEAEALAELRALASQNRVARPMIGLGYYDTLTPSVISRNVLENPSWYTAYTPYQPEISQGRLEALINFQTMVTDLTGLTTANASMLDESTAVVEGMLVARRASKSASNVFLVDADALPQTKALLEHRADAVGIELRSTRRPRTAARRCRTTLFGAFVQYPGASGRVWDPSERHRRGAGAGRARRRRGRPAGADAAALARARSAPTSRSAPPSASACRSASADRTPATWPCARASSGSCPGRLVGVSQDAAGHPAYRLSLQTREQHIRREKATSNICTAQVLLAVMASMYAVYHGPDGLTAIATEVAQQGRGARGAAALVRPAPRVGLVLRHDPRRHSGSVAAA